ncbi:MAG: hypothetical protein IJQ82_14855 [Selenomonadaceae bacterium]|nr:hypothetical protein [Selenomonadaceae bacterium]
MKKADILKAIRKIRSRSQWKDGVKFYAEWLLDNYEEHVQFLYSEWLLRDDDNEFTPPPMTEKILLNGARNWKEYSWGGCAFVYDFDICQTLATPSEQARTKDGELPPNSRESWLDVQARALAQAAELLISIVKNNK